jgi:hypothetical protein
MNGLSDKELEGIMDALLYDHLYNCMIVPETDTSWGDDPKDDNDDHVI